MPPPRRELHLVLALALALAIALMPGFAAAQQPDQVVAERVLGPQWKQLSRRAGIIFAGTVLAPAPQLGSNRAGATERLVPGTAAGTTPAVQLSFRVDEAIAGVEREQVLTIREWTGAWSGQRPMSTGQHVLMFLYPVSRLGLTSPVGGSLGQIALDPSGQNVSSLSTISSNARQPAGAINVPQRPNLSYSHAAPLGSGLSTAPGNAPAITNISVGQLQRAIRNARGE
jgi:hypothetical protein